jgi:hypothetical protein
MRLTNVLAWHFSPPLLPRPKTVPELRRAIGISKQAWDEFTVLLLLLACLKGH